MPAYTYRVTEDSYFIEGDAFRRWQVIADFENTRTGGDPDGWFSTHPELWYVRSGGPIYQGSKVYRYETDGGSGSNSTVYIDDSNYSPLPERGDRVGGHVYLGHADNRGGLMYGVQQGTGQAYPEHYGLRVSGDEGEVQLLYDNLSDPVQTLNSATIDTTGIGSNWIRLESHFTDPTHTIRATLLGDSTRELASFSADHGTADRIASGQGVGARAERRVGSDVDYANTSFDQLYLY